MALTTHASIASSSGTDPGATAPPSPDAALAPLEPIEVGALRTVENEWDVDADRTARSLPVDPSLGTPPQVPGPTRWGRFVHVKPAGAASEQLEAISVDEAGHHRLRAVRRVVLGPPLRSTAIVQERMRKLIALPVLSADALSSVAYGPEAMLSILVLAGGAGIGWSLPVSAAIAALMLAVGLSYCQTIRAYPHGGGSYIVATQNLGRVPGLVRRLA